MISVYIREQQRYSKEELIDLFELNTNEFIDFIKRLKLYGILKMVKASTYERDLSDLFSEEIGLMDEEMDSRNYYYVFVYVGILAIGNRIIKCVPKYIFKKEPLLEMKQVLRVLGRYNSKQETIKMYNGEERETAFNILAVMLYLVENYIEFGCYTNDKYIIESNGMGEIIWDNTINETFPLVQSNQVYYMELMTSNTTDDDADFFKRLHKCVVAECYNRLNSAGILELFDMDLAADSEEKLSDFGDTDSVLYRINRELDVQYMDAKKIILKTIYTYIKHSKAFEDTFGLSMYGTSSFNLVWEEVCSAVLNNQLHMQIKDLPLSISNTCFAKDERTLIEWIGKPKWRKHGGTTSVEALKTLIPDLVCIYPVDENYCFSILDAKYYLIQLTESSISGQPGVGDITKQYLYQLAFQEFIISQGYKYVQNAFLFPGENKHAEIVGEVEMELFSNLKNETIANIVGVKLPAAKMFEAYLHNERIDDIEQILGIFPQKQVL